MGPRLLLCALVVGGLGSSARGEIFGSSFRSAAWGVELAVPRGWELSEQPSYPGMILRGLEHRGGGRMSLVAERLEPEDTIAAFVERNQQALRKLRYRLAVASHSGGTVVIEATTPDRRRVVRQAYLARNGVAYVLSVASTAEAAARYLHPFDDMLRSLSFSAPLEPRPAPAAAPPPSPAAPAPAPKGP